jgi:hypothetical protein
MLSCILFFVYFSQCVKIWLNNNLNIISCTFYISKHDRKFLFDNNIGLSVWYISSERIAREKDIVTHGEVIVFLH